MGRQCLKSYLPVSLLITSNKKFFIFKTSMGCVQFDSYQVVNSLDLLTISVRIFVEVIQFLYISEKKNNRYKYLYICICEQLLIITKEWETISMSIKTGATVWLSQLGIWLLILTLVLISVLWDPAPHRALHWVWSLLRVISLLFHCPSP